MVIKAVIFDLDGTIAAFNLDYKTVRAEIRSYLIRVGVPPSVIAVNDSVFDMVTKAKLFMTNQGKSAEAVEEMNRESLKMAEKYELEAASQPSLLSGGEETLEAVKKLGLKTALCTINSANSTEHILKRFKIAKYFDAVVPRNKVLHFKPDPEHFKTALNTLETTPSETVVIGDSVTDIQAAQQVKALSVGLPTGVSTQSQLVTQGANYIITSITDLPMLIQRINKESNDS
jgi:HAD superfamily hydrolase (TIGR01509 family)